MEMTDSAGTTTTFTGTATTTPVTLPPVAGNRIEELSIRCRVDQPTATRLEFSIDGGTNWIRLRVGESRDEEPRGDLTQIQLRAAGTLTDAIYEVIMNRGQV
jgi:hypothetical protein